MPPSLTTRLLLLALTAVVSLSAQPVPNSPTATKQRQTEVKQQTPQAIPTHIAMTRRGRRVTANSTLGFCTPQSSIHHLPILEATVLPCSTNPKQAPQTELTRGRAPPTSDQAVSI